MPLPYGWGTGGIQVTAAIIGRDDTLKVIDQGADDTTNAVSHPPLLRQGGRCAPRRRSTDEATIIQTRHRVPETPLREGQILVFQVPIPEPLRMLEPRETETRTLHALSEYGVMQVSLYEDIARHGRIAKTYNYPVMVNGRYIMSPSPIPKFDNPKLDRSPALQLFGAGPREAHLRRAAAHAGQEPRLRRPSVRGRDAGTQCCALCGSRESFLDEMIVDDAGKRMFVCSDTDWCERAAMSGPLHDSAPILCFKAGSPSASATASPAATSTSTCGRAKCWAWWASRARARPRCSTAWPVG